MVASKSGRTPPRDIIGDVEGCYHELLEVIGRLGYKLILSDCPLPKLLRAKGPSKRKLVFLCDLINRGPHSDLVLNLVMQLVRRRLAIVVTGNQEKKYLRFLRGTIEFTRLHPEVQKTADSVAAHGEEFVKQVHQFLEGLPFKYETDRLIVVHGAYREDVDEKKAEELALLGETDGTSPLSERKQLMDTKVFLLFVVLALMLAYSLWDKYLRGTSSQPPPRPPPPRPPPKLSLPVTGNGFGFAVVDQTGTVVKWYAHPYRFQRPGPDITKAGVPTTNLVQALWFGPKSGLPPAATENGHVGYVSESHIVSAGTSMYFMPFDLSMNALIAVRSNDSDEAPLNVEWAHQIESNDTRESAGRQIRILQFAKVDEFVVVVPLAETTAVALLCLESGADINAAVNELVLWQNGLTPDDLCRRELADLERWRINPDSLDLTFASEHERRLFRQSETILRMSQCREPNTNKRSSNGLLVASLPDGIFFIHRVRDMVYATIALIRMGHHHEARRVLLGLFNARPVGINRSYTRGMDYQISLARYFGDGTEEDDYGGLLTPNIEFDDWGLALWALGEYVEATNDTSLLREPTYRGSTVYASARDFVLKPLLGNLDRSGDVAIVTADSSLWEESQINKRHHAFATTAAIRGLRAMIAASVLAGDAATTMTVTSAIADLVLGFRATFVHNGVLRGTIEDSFKNEIDGSLLESLLEDRLVTDPKIIERTLDKMRLLLTASGGYRRVRGDTQYERQEFLFINFLLAILHYRKHRMSDGDRILCRMVEKACADNGLIPEMYVSEKNSEFVGQIGDPTGSIPMVGYGAGMYVLALLERARNSR